MTITSVKTYKRTTIETAWHEELSPESDWVALTTSWATSGKIIATSLVKQDPLTRIFTRTFANQAAFDEWHSNPVVQAVHIQQIGYEITNNITWTRVITNNETGATTTERSTDFTLSLSKG